MTTYKKAKGRKGYRSVSLRGGTVADHAATYGKYIDYKYGQHGDIRTYDKDGNLKETISAKEAFDKKTSQFKKKQIIKGIKSKDNYMFGGSENMKETRKRKRAKWVPNL